MRTKAVPATVRVFIFDVANDHDVDGNENCE